MKISTTSLSAHMKQNPMRIINQPCNMNANLQPSVWVKYVTIIDPNMYPTMTPMTAKLCRNAIHLVLDPLGEN